MGLTEKQLAKLVRCAQSTIHDILNSPEARSSHLLPKINKAFGWAPPPEDIPHAPSPPLPTPEATEAAVIFDQLPEPLRKAKLEELRALMSLLSKPAND